MPVDKIISACKHQMQKALEYLDEELKGVRTGRASPGLVEHVKVNVVSYGSTMELRELAAISAPDVSSLLIKPYDPTIVKDIDKAILASNLGLTPMTDGGAIRLPIPALSGERRKQLTQEIRRMAESQKIAVRNLRRDANKHIEVEEKDHKISEDEAEAAKDEIQTLTRKYESSIDEHLAAKQKELEKV